VIGWLRIVMFHTLWLAIDSEISRCNGAKAVLTGAVRYTMP
jgi:hypothetical protein